MATINLGNIKFNWQGAYNGATAYAVDDVVSYNGSSYICKLASTGNLPTNTTYFDVMSSAGTNGTNGTDVGTVITTQGDLLYRDGSGLQRLGAGTAGQVLQTGGAGANPSWGSLSSDYVYIASYELTSNATTWDITGFKDDSTYRAYDIFYSNLTTPDNGSWYLMKLLHSSGVQSLYYWLAYTRATVNTSGTGGGTSNGNYDLSYYLLGQNSSSSAQGSYGRIYLENMSANNGGGSNQNYTRIMNWSTGFDGTTTLHTHYGTGINRDTGYDYTGIQFSSSGGGTLNSTSNGGTPKVKIYGYKY